MYLNIQIILEGTTTDIMHAIMPNLQAAHISDIHVQMRLKRDLTHTINVWLIINSEPYNSMSDAPILSAYRNNV